MKSFTLRLNCVDMAPIQATISTDCKWLKPGVTYHIPIDSRDKTMSFNRIDKASLTLHFLDDASRNHLMGVQMEITYFAHNILLCSFDGISGIAYSCTEEAILSK